MVQQLARALEEIVKQFWGFLLSMAPWLLLLTIAAGLAALVLYLREREGWERLWSGVRPHLAALGIGVLALLLLTLEVLLMVVGKQLVLSRREVEAGSPYMAEAEAPIGTLYQYGPVAAYLQERSYTRTHILPLQIAPQATPEQLQQILLSLQQYEARTPQAPRVETKVSRVGEQLMLTRTVTMFEEVPITFDRAEVSARFQMRQGRRGRPFHQLDFEGRYTFRNPLNQAVRGRFVFPLPEPPGTLVRRHASPRALVEGSPGSTDGSVDILAASFGHVTDDLVGGWVVSRKGFSVRRRDELAVDQELVGSDTRFGCHRGPPGSVFRRATPSALSGAVSVTWVGGVVTPEAA